MLWNTKHKAVPQLSMNCIFFLYCVVKLVIQEETIALSKLNRQVQCNSSFSRTEFFPYFPHNFTEKKKIYGDTKTAPYKLLSRTPTFQGWVMYHGGISHKLLDRSQSKRMNLSNKRRLRKCPWIKKKKKLALTHLISFLVVSGTVSSQVDQILILGCDLDDQRFGLLCCCLEKWCMLIQSI